VVAVLNRIEVSGNVKIEAWKKPEHQAGDDGNGERDQESSAVHAGSSSRRAGK
jgi:hypothetical protein